jgi:hypothetical protein
VFLENQYLHDENHDEQDVVHGVSDGAGQSTSLVCSVYIDYQKFAVK